MLEYLTNLLDAHVDSGAALISRAGGERGRAVNIVTTLFQILLFGAEAVLALMITYLLMLTGAAFFAQRHTKLRQDDSSHRFLILVPAHNEERLLPSLLANLHQLDYPAALYAVHVVADNSTDRTAELAHASGAFAHERVDEERRGKGYALHWLMQQLLASAEPHDAVLILDADSIISPNFLTVMDARLARGERAIQASYAVRDPQSSWSASLRSVALAALHYLRPLGRMPLGGSAGLKGNGMVFAAEIVREYQWSASLTEDIEYHMALILAGQRVTFAPDAIVWAEMPSSLKAALPRTFAGSAVARKWCGSMFRVCYARRWRGGASYFLMPPLSRLFHHFRWLRRQAFCC